MSAEGRKAVTRIFARILEERHPGTHWSPVEPAELDALIKAGAPIRCLAPPPPSSPGSRRGEHGLAHETQQPPKGLRSPPVRAGS